MNLYFDFLQEKFLEYFYVLIFLSFIFGSVLLLQHIIGN